MNSWRSFIETVAENISDSLWIRGIVCPDFDALSAGLIIHATATSLAPLPLPLHFCIKYALSGANSNPSPFRIWSLQPAGQLFLQLARQFVYAVCVSVCVKVHRSLQHVAHTHYAPALWTYGRRPVFGTAAIHAHPGYSTCVHIDIYLTHFMYIYIDSRMQLAFFCVSFFFSFDSLLTDDSFSSVFVHPCLNSLHTGVQGRLTAPNNNNDKKKKGPASRVLFIYICVSNISIQYIYHGIHIWINVWFIVARAIALDCVPNTKYVQKLQDCRTAGQWEVREKVHKSQASAFQAHCNWYICSNDPDRGQRTFDFQSLTWFV